MASESWSMRSILPDAILTFRSLLAISRVSKGKLRPGRNRALCVCLWGESERLNTAVKNQGNIKGTFVTVIDFSTPGVWLGCVSCASSKQLISVDLHWFSSAFAPATKSHFQCRLTNRPGFNESEYEFWKFASIFAGFCVPWLRRLHTRSHPAIIANGLRPAYIWLRVMGLRLSVSRLLDWGTTWKISGRYVVGPRSIALESVTSTTFLWSPVLAKLMLRDYDFAETDLGPAKPTTGLLSVFFDSN